MTNLFSHDNSLLTNRDGFIAVRVAHNDTSIAGSHQKQGMTIGLQDRGESCTHNITLFQFIRHLNVLSVKGGLILHISITEIKVQSANFGPSLCSNKHKLKSEINGGIYHNFVPWKIISPVELLKDSHDLLVSIEELKDDTAPL